MFPRPECKSYAWAIPVISEKIKNITGKYNSNWANLPNTWFGLNLAQSRCR